MSRAPFFLPASAGTNFMFATGHVTERVIPIQRQTMNTDLPTLDKSRNCNARSNPCCERRSATRARKPTPAKGGANKPKNGYRERQNRSSAPSLWDCGAAAPLETRGFVMFD